MKHHNKLLFTVLLSIALSGCLAEQEEFELYMKSNADMTDNTDPSYECNDRFCPDAPCDFLGSGNRVCNEGNPKQILVCGIDKKFRVETTCEYQCEFGNCIENPNPDTQCKDGEYCPGASCNFLFSWNRVCSDMDPKQVLKCDTNKKLSVETTCEYKCESGKCIENPDPQCTDGDTKCIDNDAFVCQGGDWTLQYNCEYGCKNGICINKPTDNPGTDTQCKDTEHFFANQCETDDVTHCGTHTNDCTKLSGWKTGGCIGKLCFAEECHAGFHLASVFDSNNKERTVCEEDTHDACGSINTKCKTDEICSQGRCQGSCQSGEALCNGSCINPMTSRYFCGADASCSSYTPCSEFENCISGNCVLSSCQNTEETICSENNQKVCVNIHGSNTNHCGACGAVCASKEATKASCQNGQCTYTCDSGMSNCGSPNDPLCLSETQMKTDSAHCGDCKTQCKSNEYCENGKCLISTCYNNQCKYNNNCVNTNDHCGTSCTNCNTANHASSGICESGKCKITSCAENYHLDNGSCVENSDTACPNGRTSGTDNCNTINPYTKTGICVNAKCQATECKTNAHIDNGSCVEDSDTACPNGRISGTDNCNTIDEYTVIGICVNAKCQATQCAEGYHPDNGSCVVDSDTACPNGRISGTDNCNTINEYTKTGICVDAKCQATECRTNAYLDNGTCLPDDVMKSVWDVTSDNLTVTFPIQGRSGTITIDWGDGSANTTISSGSDKYVAHPYSSAGKYTITVTGRIDAWRCYYNSDFHGLCSQLVEIKSYGNTTFGERTFHYAEKLVKLPVGSTPKFLNNSMQYVFYYATRFNQNINFWDTSNVRSMGGMFYGATSFNQPLNNWDTSNVISMSGMFYGATSFNQPLDNWDTSNVTSMSYMFYGATSFNQPLDNWNVSKVTKMYNMFYYATSFNQPLANWDTSNVTYMSSMFQEAKSFNQPLANWDTSNVTYMGYMFYGATSFNQPLDNWDTSNVTSMGYMFDRATSFNQPLNNWDTSNVTNMTEMFRSATSFNQPLDNWNVSNVTSMNYMFYAATSFNQPLDNWNVSNVTNMDNMFYASGLKKDNYCGLFAGAYTSVWQKYVANLGLSYTCP